MRMREIMTRESGVRRVNERVDSHDLYFDAREAVLDALRRPFNGLRERVSEIQSALEGVARPYAAQWKSDQTNARGYQFNKIELSISVRLSPKSGGSFGTKKLSTGELHGELTILVKPYDALQDVPVPASFASAFADEVAQAFSHEMVHYTQEVRINTLDPAKRSSIRRANALPVTDAESEAMTDDRRAQYLASKNEVDAYAANAATQLANSIGVDQAMRGLTDLSTLAANSEVVSKFTRLVKKTRPKAWRRFVAQVAWNLDRLRERDRRTDAVQK